MKSETLSQFQSSMYELHNFGRGKDKVKRTRKKTAQFLTNTAGALGVKNKTLNTDANKKKNLSIAAKVGGAGAALAGAALLLKNKGKIGMMAKNAAKKVNSEAYKAGTGLGNVVNKVKQGAMNATARGERIVNKRKASTRVAGLLSASKPRNIPIQ